MPTLESSTRHGGHPETRTDLDSTYLGGSAALVEAVLGHALLEAWPVTALDPITIDSDRINL